MNKGQSAFSDTTLTIEALAPELEGLNALRFSRTRQMTEGTMIEVFRYHTLLKSW